MMTIRILHVIVFTLLLVSLVENQLVINKVMETNRLQQEINDVYRNSIAKTINETNISQRQLYGEYKDAIGSLDDRISALENLIKQGGK